MEESLELVPDAVYGLNDGLIGKKLTYFLAGSSRDYRLNDH